MQERCQELVCTLKQVQQHLQQQQHLVQPVATTTAQQQAELSECKRQLADTQTRLAEVTTLATAEKAARIAAEDIEVERQQLLQQLGSLRQDLSDLHAKVLAERQTNCAIRDELTLVTKSRDTWRVGADMVEAFVRPDLFASHYALPVAHTAGGNSPSPDSMSAIM